MIDTHSHIYLDAFDHDRSETIARAKGAGVTNILLPNIDAESIEAMLACESNYPAVCRAMMGLHPTSVNADFKTQLAIVEQWLAKRKFAGIGEIGMDLYWDQAFIEEQKEVLAQQLKWACEMDLPVVIHTRNAFPEIFEVFNRVYDPKLRGVFHSFSGTYDDALRILEMPGFYLGINGVVTYKNSTLPSILKQTGIGRVLLETDAPYLTPVPHRGKRNEPAYLSLTRDKLAQIFHIDAAEIDRITSDNAVALFG